jgi:hypothetical protein
MVIESVATDARGRQPESPRHDLRARRVVALVGVCAAALFLAARAAGSSSAVQVWGQTWTGGGSFTTAPVPVAARELVDGTTMIVGPPAIRYDHDGNLLSTANFSPPFFSSITLPPPNISQASLVAIDPFGGVFVASASDLTQLRGDIWLMKYDGFTGKAVWSEPLIYDDSTHRVDIPLLLFSDSAGDAVVVGRSTNFDIVLMKVRGITGQLLWGPTIIAGGALSRGSLDPAGNLLLAVFRPQSGFSDLYKFDGQNGAVVWGPIQFAGSAGYSVSALAAGPDGNVFVAGRRSDRIELFKYNGVAGSVLWGPVFYTETNSTAPQATDIGVGATGDVIVSGISSDHFLILKYGGAAGNLLWGPQITQPKYTSIPLTVQLAGNGDVVASAWDQNSTLSTWRYAGSNGLLLWGPQTVTGAVSDTRRPQTLICSNGRILTTFSGPSGLSTLERDPATGMPVWGPVSFTRTFPSGVSVTDVTQDTDGNVLVTGYGPSTTYVTAKIARSNGAVLWVAVTPDVGGFIPMTVRTDASGNVFVLGQTGVVLKYSGATGALIWQREPGVNLSGWRLAIDAAGDVLVSEQLVKGPFGSEYDFVTFKLSGATGATLWGPVVFDRGPGTADWPTAIAITPGGDVVVAGISQNSSPPGSSEWVTLKYSGAAGSLIWGPVSLPQPFSISRDSVADLAIDTAGDIVVVGASITDTTQPMTTIKYNGATGAVLWGPLTTVQDGSATAVALAANGDVFVTGYAFNGPGRDFATFKYRGSDGAVLWGPRFFAGSAGDTDLAWAIGLDSAGNPVVAGTTRNAAHNKDVAIVKYDGATGVPLWEPVIAGGLGNDDLLLHDMVVRGKSVVIAGAIGSFLAAAYDEVFGIQSLPEDVPPAYCGNAYSKTLVAGNATGSVAWSVDSGALPTGLSLDGSTGEISGTPQAVGSFAFRIKAQDSLTSAFRDFFIDVFEGGAFVPILSSSNPVCLGQSTTLSVSGSWTSYHWLPGGETSPTISVSPGETTDYGVVLEDATGCVARGYLRVSVGSLLMVTLAAGNNGPICEGQSLQLSASTVPGATYAWTGPSGFTSAEQNPQILSAPLSAAGVYGVTATVDGCASPAATTTVVVRALPSAAISAPASICPDSGNSASVASAGAGATYSWTIGNGTITSGAGTPAITFTAGPSGSVQLDVTVTDANGCSASGSRSVSITAGPECGSAFFTVPPCRVLDTRNPIGPLGGPSLTGGDSRTFVLTESCGIPATATAVSVNIAETQAQGSGHLRIHPAGSPLPNTAVINFSAGQTRSNNAILTLGPSGDINVYVGIGSGLHVDFILDVNGYFQ